ncbi:nucleotidyltransferase domain-containing protein [Algoriphagus sp.]|uniref:nucleotidyltransferase domain-containing protein n=1 Tax=Algoriphagus sp. TaxID=1872435 RepID=UPI00391A7DFB
MNNFGLKNEVVEKIRNVLDLFPSIKKCIIYGSRAIGNYRYNSDIDLTLVGENITFSELLKIENELDDLLLPYQIDLSILKKIDNKDLIDHINRVGKVFFERKKTPQLFFE